ncbi:hypothetical protein ACQR16_24495 [Bradyrhizobium oligotrophicum]|uniref:hypothetical protein n=1 Tax=Bradyrhizobium oligotrophicum TaxID=44255 RepID=UPI003EBA843A
MARSFEQAPWDATNIVPGFSPGFPPPLDVVELLPASRQPLLLSLRQRAEDAMNLQRPLFDQLGEARADKHRLNARIAHLKTPRGQGGPGLDDDDVSVIDAARKLAAVDAEMTRLNELLETRQARSRNAGASVTNLEGWLRTGRPGGTAIVPADDIDVASVLKKGETVAAALDRIRRRLRELDADEHRVKSAPIPAAYAKAQARAAIEQLAERGTPDVSALVEAGHAIGWPLTMQRLGLAAIVGKTGDQIVGNAMGEVIDTAALFVWLHRDALVARLEREIDAITDDVAALSPQDRERKLSEIAQDKLAIERSEASLVWSLQRDGLPVEHRTDADPRAVLGVELQVIAKPEGSKPLGMAAKAVQVIETR